MANPIPRQKPNSELSITDSSLRRALTWKKYEERVRDRYLLNILHTRLFLSYKMVQYRDFSMDFSSAIGRVGEVPKDMLHQLINNGQIGSILFKLKGSSQMSAPMKTALGRSPRVRIIFEDEEPGPISVGVMKAIRPKICSVRCQLFGTSCRVCNPTLSPALVMRSKYEFLAREKWLASEAGQRKESMSVPEKVNEA